MNKERLDDALSDLADHTSQALRDTANDKPDSAAIAIAHAEQAVDEVRHVVDNVMPKPDAE